MKKVLVIINVSKDESLALSTKVSDFLKRKGYEVVLLSYDGFCDNTSFAEFSFVVSLGGDGTVLYAARNSVDFDIPVFPINLGEFGFIASINKEEWEKQLDLFLNDKALYQERTMIKANLFRNDKLVAESYALNDVVISAKNTARTVALDVSYNSSHLCKLKSDGVIVSTATGSTAYSASAGGPIVEPSLNAFVFTPINSFSLSSRPIVLNGEGKIEIVIQPCRTKEICMIVDGQEPVSLQTNDKIVITTIEKKIRLICSTKDNFYDALRSKMNWSGGPHA
ncbi:MAG: NAD(+)/NADH kinase [Treponema sp.]|nr:NAD(+)/NADH kinase [Treponema sp.]